MVLLDAPSTGCSGSSVVAVPRKSSIFIGAGGVQLISKASHQRNKRVPGILGPFCFAERWKGIQGHGAVA